MRRMWLCSLSSVELSQGLIAERDKRSFKLASVFPAQSYLCGTQMSFAGLHLIVVFLCVHIHALNNKNQFFFVLGLSNGDFHHVQKPDGQRVSARLDDHESSPNESLSAGDWPVLRCSQQILPGLHSLPLAGQFNEDCKGVSNTQLRFTQDRDYIAGNIVIHIAQATMP